MVWSLVDWLASLAASSSYFGISTEDTIRIGIAAQAYTRGVLTSRSNSDRFIVYTQWSRVSGTTNRYWAHVVIDAAINRHDDHTYLAEQLVHDGLVAVDRRISHVPPWPDARSAESIMQHLTMLESHAKAVRRGAWKYKPLLRKPISSEHVYSNQH